MYVLLQVEVGAYGSANGGSMSLHRCLANSTQHGSSLRSLMTFVQVIYCCYKWKSIQNASIGPSFGAVRRTYRFLQ
jgi:hypothetical protein